MTSTTLKGTSWISESDDAASARIDNSRMLPAPPAGAGVVSTCVTTVNVVCKPGRDRAGARLVLSRMLVITRESGAAAAGNVVCTLNCSR